MAGDHFDHELRRVIHDHADVGPPAALEEWLEDLPARTTPHRRSLMRLVVPLAAAAAIVVLGAMAMSVYWSQLGSAVPAAVPSGQPLAIVTEPTTYPGDACRLSLRHAVLMRRSGSELVFSQAGQDIAITWPYGTTAVLVNGQAELFAPDGTLVALEGQTLPDLGGGLGADDRFHVCAIGGHPYR